MSPSAVSAGWSRLLGFLPAAIGGTVRRFSVGGGDEDTAQFYDDLKLAQFPGLFG
jgi:hypothetical protein